MRRAIRAIYKGEPVTEGAGVKLRRVFGYHEAPDFDPFLMLDDFRSDQPKDFQRGFPWHPHRGIETITYVIKGDVEHGDSLGNKGVISSGDVQWMTAGSGIVHQEMPKGDAHGSMHGFQLWANLPASEKMMPPRYRGLTAKEIPEVQLPDGARIKVIAGLLNTVRGPWTTLSSSPNIWIATCQPECASSMPYPATTRPSSTSSGAKALWKRKLCKTAPWSFSIPETRWMSRPGRQASDFC